MKILSVFNIKGGVGKTAAAVNLAYLSSDRGRRTLLVDLDPQGAAGFYLRVSSRAKARVPSLLRGGKRASALIRKSDYPGLDVLPASRGMRNLDRFLAGDTQKRKRMDSVVKQLGKGYDRIIVDCPPHFGLLSENVFSFSDTVLVPVVPSVLSSRTLGQLAEFFRDRKFDRKKITAYYSMVDRRKRLHRETVEEPSRSNITFLAAMIPVSSAVERMGIARKPLLAYDARSTGAKAFVELERELVGMRRL